MLPTAPSDIEQSQDYSALCALMEEGSCCLIFSKAGRQDAGGKRSQEKKQSVALPWPRKLNQMNAPAGQIKTRQEILLPSISTCPPAIFRGIWRVLPEDLSPQMAHMCLVKEAMVPAGCAGTLRTPLSPKGGLMSSVLLTGFMGELSCAEGNTHREAVIVEHRIKAISGRAVHIHGILPFRSGLSPRAQVSPNASSCPHVLGRDLLSFLEGEGEGRVMNLRCANGRLTALA